MQPRVELVYVVDFEDKWMGAKELPLWKRFFIFFILFIFFAVYDLVNTMNYTPRSLKTMLCFLLALPHQTAKAKRSELACYQALLWVRLRTIKWYIHGCVKNRLHSLHGNFRTFSFGLVLCNIKKMLLTFQLDSKTGSTVCRRCF